MFDVYHGMWGMHWLWWIFWIVAMIVAVWLITSRRSAPPPPSPETPLDILKRRYAAGEITADEYEQMRARLGDPS